MSSIEDITGVSTIPKYLDGLDFNDAGQLAIAASNLTGRTWNGVLAVYDDAKFAPHIPHIDYAALNEAGCTDVSWIDSKRLALSTDAGTVEVWELRDSPSMENTIMLAEHDDVCSAISLSKGLKQIASASWDGSVKLWDLEVDLSIHNIRIHLDKVLDVAWNEFISNVFATASEDGTVKLYDNRDPVTPASTLLSLCSHFPVCIGWVNEYQLCMGDNNGKLCVTDTRYPKENITESKNHKKSINNILCFGDYIVTGSNDCTMNIQFSNNLRVLYTDSRHTDYVKGLGFNACDQTVWSSAWDGNIYCHRFNAQNI